jgi:MFS family permease
MFANQTQNLSTIRLTFISFAHLIIGVGIVALSTYIPAELRFLGWQTEIIAYIIGFVTLFELSRMVVGFFADTHPLFGSYRRNYVVLGFLISSLGFVVIILFINSLFIVLGMVFYTIGSAIMSTMIDAYLIGVSAKQNKNKIAAMTQFFRLSGFALGGILGVIFYGRFNFESFYFLLFGIHIIGSIVSILLISEEPDSVLIKEKEDKTTFISAQENFKEVFRALISKPVLGMSLFLILYPIGLFAQDAILEPFAIDYLGFQREGIGRMASIWGTTTLIFIPLAIKIEKILGRIPTIFSGLSIASVSLLVISSLALNPPDLLSSSEIQLAQNLLLISLASFGAGLGLMTTPGTAMMFDVCAYNSRLTASLIAFFGVLITLSRSLASFFAGIIIQFSGNYVLLFTLEAIILFSSLFPLIYVARLKIIPLGTVTPSSVKN